MARLKKIEFSTEYRNHFGFWGIFFLINWLRWGSYFDDYPYSFKSNLIEFSLHIPFVYFNLLVLIPKYIVKFEYYKYALALLGSLIIIYVARTGLTYYMVSENIWPEADKLYRPFDINHIVAVTIGEIYVLSIASSVFSTMYWLKERDRNAIMKQNQSKMKLKYLKTQIQPHFFFNTLNNLYALSLESSKKVPDVILKLSRLMEYVLYDIKGTQMVDLTKEIDYIQNYIEIEKLRFEQVEVAVNIESNIDDIKIPPLLIITLIENAFKHGGPCNSNLRIKINCKVIKNETLQFEILNNFVISQNPSNKKGIGLSNTKKRLKLIFQNNFTLEKIVKFNYYIIRLQIPIQHED
ncbi:histidine kinase [Flavobacterium sp. PL12]|uniref:sensor histidine kinase n=1 Tax=Flavobacterium sp. PL12 TaxID=3071718 RepID=UPI00319DEB84